MKRLFLILSLIFFAKTGFPQTLLETYYCDVSDFVSCELLLFENNEYQLNLEELVSDDQILVSTMSSGKSNQTADTLILTDQCHGYKMKLLKIDDGVVFIHSFCFLKNKVLQYFNGRTDYFYSPVQNIDMSSEKKAIEQHNELYKQEYELPLGPYHSREGFNIKLLPFRLYQLDFKGCRLSLGYWNRKGNVITLKDPNLPLVSYLLIRKKGLVGKLLPGDFSDVDVIFKPKISKTK